MPELPEVQTVVNDLSKKIVGKRILRVWFDWPKLIKSSTPEAFRKLIKGTKILKIRRRAKNILIFLDGDKVLLIHLKMTGHLLVGKWRIRNSSAAPLSKGRLMDKVNSYIHFIFYLDDGSMLGFSDVRKFGKIIVQAEKKNKTSSHGPKCYCWHRQYLFR
ncbi:MAG: hypothetical protein HYR95_00280 [Candidatus Colwellbacteria bacterium]|nr:hypothetical protein [Candidatus Colwellbacteria bacterium]